MLNHYATAPLVHLCAVHLRDLLPLEEVNVGTCWISFVLKDYCDHLLSIWHPFYLSIGISSMDWGSLSFGQFKSVVVSKKAFFTPNNRTGIENSQQ